jgi:hypothetical protein
MTTAMRRLVTPLALSLVLTLTVLSALDEGRTPRR